MFLSQWRLWSALLFIRTVTAVFADDAWSIDYHHALLGQPLADTTFFHPPSVSSRGSLLYTLTGRSVLGAVDPRDGNIVWRQQLGNGTTTSTHLRSGQDQEILISAVDGQVGAWRAADGRSVWQHNTGTGVSDLEVLELTEGNSGVRTKDALVLSASTPPTLSRLDGATGRAKWTFKDESGDTGFQVSASATHVFLISLHGSMLGSSKIRVTSLDPTNGRKVDQYTASDSDISSTTDILTVGANTASPIIAWTDKTKSTLKVNVIGSKAVQSFDIKTAKGELVEDIRLHAPYETNALPHFLVHFQTATEHWADVFHVNLKAAAVSKAYSLSKIGGRGVFSTSSVDANVYFARITEDEISVVSSVSHGILKRWPLNLGNAKSKLGQVTPVHATVELFLRGEAVNAARCAILLSDGQWVQAHDGVIGWTRPEMLADTKAAVWVKSSSQPAAVAEIEREAHMNVVSAYFYRLSRHLHDLRALPGFVNGLPSRLLHSVGLRDDLSGRTQRRMNSFGYHQTVVCVTSSNRLVALDAGSKGVILWNVPVPDNFITSSSVNPQILSRADGTVQLVDGATGASLIFNGTNGAPVTTTQASDTVGAVSSGFWFDKEAGQVVGHAPGSPNGSPVWTFSASNDETIQSVVSRPAEDPVAEVGKVLGDRKVLYKYLNPNLILVVATSASRKTATVSIVDSLTGYVLSSSSYEHVDVSLPIPAAMSENWFAYSLAVDSPGSTSRGFQLVVGELFESSLPDDRGPLWTHNASASSLDYQPTIMTQTYNIPEPISFLTVSQTSQGITSRELLAVLPESDAIIGINRAFIDPRRPVNRDPSKLEAMEGLMKYNPILEFDPKWYISHQRELVGIEKISTSPARLESTSLLFAYGLDVFGTRLSPSFSFDVLGKDFNKLQMLGTVVALAIATLVVAPLVERKQINGRWLFS